MSEVIADFVSSLKDSAFSRHYYQVDCDLSDWLESILMYLDRPAKRKFENGELSIDDAVAAVLDRIPPFQRNNDKWTYDMQVAFILNLLKGFRGNPLCFYAYSNSSGKDHCFIMDGLQRLTAIIRFFFTKDMDIPLPSGETISAAEFLASEAGQVHLRVMFLPLRIYTFDNEIEAVKFYIEMNENMTHSADDIVRAKQYLSSLVE